MLLRPLRKKLRRRNKKPQTLSQKILVRKTLTLPVVWLLNYGTS